MIKCSWGMCGTAEDMCILRMGKYVTLCLSYLVLRAFWGRVSLCVQPGEAMCPVCVFCHLHLGEGVCEYVCDQSEET